MVRRMVLGGGRNRRRSAITLSACSCREGVHPWGREGGEEGRRMRGEYHSLCCEIAFWVCKENMLYLSSSLLPTCTTVYSRRRDALKAFRPTFDRLPTSSHPPPLSVERTGRTCSEPHPKIEYISHIPPPKRPLTLAVYPPVAIALLIPSHLSVKLNNLQQ